MAQREMSDSAFELVNRSIRRARAFGEDEERLSFASEQRADVAECFTQTGAAIDGREVGEILQNSASYCAFFEEIVTCGEGHDDLRAVASREHG